MLKQVMGLSLVIILSNAEAGFERKTMSEYWSEVEMGYPIFKMLARPTRCQEKLENFLACVHGANAILGAANQKVQLVPKSQLKDNPLVLATVESFGVADLVEMAPSKKEKSIVAQVKRMKIEQAAGFQAWKNVYESKEGATLDFTALLDSVEKKAIAGARNETEVVAAGINLFLGTADDPHTRIAPQHYFEDEQTATQQSFTGIGVQIRVVEGELVVIQPVEGGPSHKAGIRAKDVITHVNGESLQGIPLEDAMKRLKGPKGSEVKLTLRRQGKGVEVTVIRDEIVARNVAFKMLPETRKRVGYLKLSDFMQGDPATDLKNALEELKKSSVEGLVFDMRGNPGGRLDHAVKVANLFVGKGETIVIQKALGTKQVIDTQKTQEDAATDLPLVTLVDGGSASAAEIVSGALQDLKRGLVLGVRSFGKGSVQGVKPWGVVSGVLLIRTQATFHLPSGRSNQILGVIPDIEVYSNPNPTEEDRFALREEDIYMNALPVTSEAFEPLQPQLTRSVSECVARTGEAKKRFTEGEENIFVPDYQVLVAEDVLSCQ